jgi:hypothetical protein
MAVVEEFDPHPTLSQRERDYLMPSRIKKSLSLWERVG